MVRGRVGRATGVGQVGSARGGGERAPDDLRPLDAGDPDGRAGGDRDDRAARTGAVRAPAVRIGDLRGRGARRAPPRPRCPGDDGGRRRGAGASPCARRQRARRGGRRRCSTRRPRGRAPAALPTSQPNWRSVRPRSHRPIDPNAPGSGSLRPRSITSMPVTSNAPGISFSSSWKRPSRGLPGRARSCCSARPLSTSARSTTRFAISGMRSTRPTAILPRSRTADVEIVWVLSRSLGSFDDAAAAAARALAAAEELGDDSTPQLQPRPVDGDRLLRPWPPARRGEARTRPRARGSGLAESDREAAELHTGLDAPHAEQPDRARQLLEALRTHLVERGEECDLPELLGVMAHLECVAGNLDAASALADRGYDLAQQAGSDSLAAATRPSRAHRRRTRGQGRRDASRSRRGDRCWPTGAGCRSPVSGRRRQSRCWSSRSVTTRRSWRRWRSSLEIIETQGLVEPSRQPFLPDAIEALVRLGDLARAEASHGQLEERGRALIDRPWVIAHGSPCRALVLAAQGDVANALAVLDQRSPNSRNCRCRSRTRARSSSKGSSSAAGDRSGQRTTSLRRALELCEEIGATSGPSAHGPSLRGSDACPIRSI